MEGNIKMEYDVKRDQIYAEWRKFHNNRDTDAAIVRGFIRASWRRCRELGVNPQKPASASLSPAQAKEELEKHALLIESSRPIMERIYALIADSKSVISLASGGGVILHTLPAGASPAPGAISREEYCGTAGIATCLEEKKQLEVFAAEHYCARNHGFVCSAAPIYDKQGALIGVLGVTAPCVTFHPHTSGMLAAAVYAISEQLGLRALVDERNALLELMDEGVIMLDSRRIVRFSNAKAGQMLGWAGDAAGRQLDDAVRLTSPVTNMLEKGASFQDMDTTITSGGRPVSCVLSCSVNSSTGGMMLVLREAERMREFAARYTGAKATFTFNDILGKSPGIRETVAKARRIAGSDTTVLLLGESGTGKELFAQALHNASPRKKEPFVVVNCGALPRELIQSELFGYSEGAFTGAARQGKPGKFELAHGGTIFLDEIGEMPLDVQVNLLRLLQNREVVRIGGKRSRIVDIRVIAATNRNLSRAVKQGVFREDLYYRLNVFPLSIPPLRERAEDIPPLARHFMDKFTQKAGAPRMDLAPGALEAMLAYAWPGNIRELENMMERLVYLASSSVISQDDLPAHIAVADAPQPDAVRAPSDDKPNDPERAAMEQALAKSGGRIAPALKTLGLNRSTFYYRAKKLGVNPAKFRHRPEQPVEDSGLRGEVLRWLMGMSREQLNALAAITGYADKQILDK